MSEKTEPQVRIPVLQSREGSSIGRTHKFIVDPVRDPISNTKKTKTGSAKPMMSVRIRPLPFFSIVSHLCQPYAYPISLV